MRTLLKIQASLFGNQGQSSLLAAQFVSRWQHLNPGGRVINRDLAAEPVPHLDLARFQALITADDMRTPEQQAVVSYSDALIAELVSADVIVMAVPMYNFSVPSTLSAYFDHIARSGITFRYTPEGPEGLLKNKTAYVFIARGGAYGEEHSQNAFLRQFLGFVGIGNLKFIHAEGLAMDEASKKEALTSANQKLVSLVTAA